MRILKRLTAFFLPVAVALVFIVGPWRFSYYSICSTCGCVRDSSERQLPFISFTYWTTHKIQPTEISGLELVPQHEHEWVFGHGAGNGIRCALGSGAQVRFIADSDLVAHFLKNARMHDGDESVLQWLDRVLDPETSQEVQYWLLDTGFPESGIQSAHEYNVWYKLAQPRWNELVNDLR